MAAAEVQYGQTDRWSLVRPLVKGRAPRADATEVAIDERAAKTLGVGVGDEIAVRALTDAEIGDGVLGSRVGDGPSTHVTITGVIRAVVAPAGTGDAREGTGAIYVVGGGGWWASQPPDRSEVAPLRVWFDRTVDQERFATSVADAAQAMGRQAIVDSISNPNDEGLWRAVSTESGAALAVAMLALLAVVVFVGQTVLRQTTREFADAPTMRAIGMTRAGPRAAAVLRTLPMAVGSAIVAVAVAVALSPVGPIGLARRAEIDPGVHADIAVLVFGAVFTMLVVVGAAFVAVLVARRGVRRIVGRARGSGRLPVGAMVGLTLSRFARGRIAVGGAMAGTALAVGCVTAAFVLLGSLDDLRANRERIGVQADATTMNSGGSDDTPYVEAAKRSGVVAAASTTYVINTGLPGGRNGEPLIALDPRIGTGIEPIYLDGRGPRATDEIAIGSASLSRLGLGVGDTITGVGAGIGETLGPLRIVGRVVIPTEDGSAGPGRGAILTKEQLAAIRPLGGMDQFIVTFDPTVPREKALATLNAEGVRFSLTSEPPEVANLARITAAPKVLAALVSALAAGALVHALLSAIRRHRRTIGVVRALGFTRTQVSSAVAWQATMVALAATVVGLAAGVIGGRWGWGVVARRVGVESPAQVPTPIVAAVILILGVTAFANLVALLPGIRAARTDITVALRAETT